MVPATTLFNSKETALAKDTILRKPFYPMCLLSFVSHFRWQLRTFYSRTPCWKASWQLWTLVPKNNNWGKQLVQGLCERESTENLGVDCTSRNWKYAMEWVPWARVGAMREAKMLRKTSAQSCCHGSWWVSSSNFHEYWDCFFIFPLYICRIVFFLQPSLPLVTWTHFQTKRASPRQWPYASTFRVPILFFPRTGMLPRPRWYHNTLLTGLKKSL